MPDNEARESPLDLIKRVGFTIIVRLPAVVGFHRWPEAPKEVEYLASPHRHLFSAEVRIGPIHGYDRAIEFHMVQQRLTPYFRVLVPQDAARAERVSCEEIAAQLARYTAERYPGVTITARVMEDGECGSEVTLCM